MQRRTRHSLLAFCAASTLALTPLHAANLVVDSLELVTYGALNEESGLFTINSRLDFGLSIGGGEKFSGLLRMNFLSTQVESDLASLQQPVPATDPTVLTNPLDPLSTPVVDPKTLVGWMDLATSRLNAPGLRLKTVAVTAKRLFGQPMEAAYFVGYLDTFCSGDDFVDLFGATPFATQLRGPLRYPDGIKENPTVSWDGIQSVYGTGFRFGLAPNDRSRIYAYAYQDADFAKAGRWSADLRGLVDFDTLKLEAFAGGTYDPSHDLGLYRAGLLFHSAPGDIGEFYAQIGAPQWDPMSSISVNDIFFLFEPRVNFTGGGQLALSVFYHPAVYRQKPTGEGGSLDVGFNLRFGRISETGMQGGVESVLAFRIFENNPLIADISPYYEVITSGVAWSFKLGIRPFPFPSLWYGIFRPFVGVKTSY